MIHYIYLFMFYLSIYDSFTVKSVVDKFIGMLVVISLLERLSGKTTGRFDAEDKGASLKTLSWISNTESPLVDLLGQCITYL